MSDTSNKTRDQLRSQIFSAAKPASKTFTFFGAEIELRQPTMGVIMEAQKIEDRARAAALMVVRYAYVPGTEEKVFDEADVDTILSMPFGKDLRTLNETITELTGVDVAGEEGN